MTGTGSPSGQVELRSGRTLLLWIAVLMQPSGLYLFPPSPRRGKEGGDASWSPLTTALSLPTRAEGKKREGTADRIRHPIHSGHRGHPGQSAPAAVRPHPLLGRFANPGLELP